MAHSQRSPPKLKFPEARARDHARGGIHSRSRQGANIASAETNSQTRPDSVIHPPPGALAAPAVPHTPAAARPAARRTPLVRTHKTTGRLGSVYQGCQRVPLIYGQPYGRLPYGRFPDSIFFPVFRKKFVVF